MNIILPIWPFVLKPGLIVIIYRRAFRIEQIERLQLNTERLSDFVAQATVERDRRSGTNAIVLNQRTWAEIAKLQCPKVGAKVSDRHCEGRYTFDRSWNAGTRWVGIPEPCLRIRDVGIDCQPMCGFVVVREFDTNPPARATGRGGARIALEN
jgi:hypothetical protein